MSLPTTGEWAQEQPPQYATGKTSALVEMITPPLLAPFDESKKIPIIVTVMRLLDESDASKVVMIMDADVGAVTVADAPPLMATRVEFPRAKNPDGYSNLMLLPGDRAPPTEGVNENVIAATVLPRMRPEPAITNKPMETWPPMIPEETPSEASVSALVVTTMSSVCPIEDGPIVSP